MGRARASETSAAEENTVVNRILRECCFVGCRDDGEDVEIERM